MSKRSRDAKRQRRRVRRYIRAVARMAFWDAYHSELPPRFIFREVNEPDVAMVPTVWHA